MIEPSYFWLNVSLLALGTLTIRGSMIAISGRVEIPERVKELFSFIPAAVLPALILPPVFFHQGTVDWAFGKERFVILIVATAICYLTRNMLATIGVGLVALYLLTQLN